MSGRSRRRRAVVLAVPLVAMVSGACSAILGLEPPPAPSQGDAATGDAGCAVRYVSTTTGNDSNDGCSPAAAKKTIKATAAVYANANAPGYTIQVCAGTYPEADLRVTVAGSLLGGFDCATWKRTAAYKSDGVNETIVTVAAPDANNAVALTLNVPPGGPSLLVDGFTLRGPSGAGLTRSIGVQFLEKSGGTLSNCKVLAGDAATSLGISLGEATPEITKNIIRSGTAGQTMGIFVSTLATGGGPFIHANAITAGSQDPSSTLGILGSYGIYLAGPLEMTAARGNPIADNLVVGGQGTPSIGIELLNVAATDVIHNHVEGGVTLPLAAGATPGIGLRAIVAYNGSNVRVLGNRVYGGGSAPGAGSFEGVVLQKTKGGVIANNMIYGGFRQSNNKSPGSANAIDLLGCPSPMVVNNTLFGGFGGPVTGINLAQGTTGAVVRNNILAGNGVNDYGLRVDDCTGEVASLTNNLFFATNNGPLRAACANGDGGVTTTNVTDLAGLAVLKNAQLGANLTLRASCSNADLADDTCLIEPNCGRDAGADCLTRVFPAWSTLDNGYTDLVGDGWLLRDDVSCRIAKGGVDLATAPGATVTADLYGTPRGSTPSMGAAESDGGCTP